MMNEGGHLAASQEVSLALDRSAASGIDQSSSKAVLSAIQALQAEVGRLESQIAAGRQRECQLAEKAEQLQSYWSDKLEQELIRNAGLHLELSRLEEELKSMAANNNLLAAQKADLERQLGAKAEAWTVEKRDLQAFISSTTDKLMEAERQASNDQKALRQVKDKLQKDHQTELDNLNSIISMLTDQVALGQQTIERQAKENRQLVDSMNKKFEKREKQMLKEIESLKLNNYQLANESKSVISGLKAKKKEAKDKIANLRQEIEQLAATRENERQVFSAEIDHLKSANAKATKSVQRYRQ
jgi:chromosome segregation ATPase